MLLLEPTYSFSVENRHLKIIIRRRAVSYIKNLRYFYSELKERKDFVQLVYSCWMEAISAKRISDVVIVIRCAKLRERNQNANTPFISGDNNRGWRINILIDNIYQRIAKDNKTGNIEFLKGIIESAIEHEASHLLVFQENKYLRLRYETWKKLKKLRKNKFSIRNPSFAQRRKWLFEIFARIQLEGIAKILDDKEIIKRELKENDQNLYWIYEYHEEAARYKGILSLCENPAGTGYYEPNDFYNKIGESYYFVGRHCVYAVLCHYNLKIEDIIKMPLPEFIKRYEEAAHHFNIRPIISWDTGEGYLDYKTALKNLWIKFQGRNNSILLGKK